MRKNLEISVPSGTCPAGPGQVRENSTGPGGASNWRSELGRGGGAVPWFAIQDKVMKTREQRLVVGAVKLIPCTPVRGGYGVETFHSSQRDASRLQKACGVSLACWCYPLFDNLLYVQNF